ncbi:MAG: hypothetical protein HY894_07950 [Deltaproteobacteria bacterium]|nr:hypothetical protein [Deltaproteobacteria bacterium]
MAISLSSAFLAELKKNVNQPNVVIEAELDSGVKKFGFHKGWSGAFGAPSNADGSHAADGGEGASGNAPDASAGFTGVIPCLKSVSSLQNKIDPKAGYTTRGQLTCVITGRENWQGLVRDEYLKNRRATRKDGFIAPGFAYSDYAATLTGKIIDWSRKGDDLTLVIGDEMYVNSAKKLPVENATKTQYLDYRNAHPVDVMTDILSTRLGIDGAYIDSAKFALERDTWLQGWVFDRVLTEPKDADTYLNELQIETNSYIVHDGEKVSFKVFAPPVPGQSIEEWTDGAHILSESFTQKSGYKDGFYNRVVIYYDYDESGSEAEANFDAAVITADAASQDATQWDEASTKVVKSKWIRTRTCAQPSNITGVVVYHASRANGLGSGYLSYNKANNTLQWTAPGDYIGPETIVSKDGKYQVYGSDPAKYARVVVAIASLPASDANDTIAITRLAGDTFAATLAQKLINRYRDPAATVAFDVDINNAAWNAQFIKPTDLKDVTTDEACEKGEATWAKERVMLTSVRPDVASGKVNVEAVETKFYRRYGFIAPAGLPDYPSATSGQREYAFIGDSSNKVNAGSVDGYYIW